jgi:hypothetical protein
VDLIRRAVDRSAQSTLGGIHDQHLGSNYRSELFREIEAEVIA